MNKFRNLAVFWFVINFAIIFSYFYVEGNSAGFGVLLWLPYFYLLLIPLIFTLVYVFTNRKLLFKKKGVSGRLMLSVLEIAFLFFMFYIVIY